MTGRFAVRLGIALAAFVLVSPVAARPLPADVRAFIARRDACDHFRGEEPYDRARADELKIKLAQTCTGSDDELAALRRKYAHDRKVVKRLSRYQERVDE